MANVEHSTLTTTNLHENKGVSTATDNTVATAVTGATVWAKLTASNLTGTGNPFGAQLFHVQDQKASGTASGNFTSGSWQTRVLNTTLTNEIASASLAANQISLPAGTYFIQASAPGTLCTLMKLKLYNVSDGSDILIGQSVAVNNAVPVTTELANVSGRFTLAGTKTLELRHRCSQTRNTDGLGQACSFGVVEVYAEVMIWKVL